MARNPSIIATFERMEHRLGGACLGCVVMTIDAEETHHLWLYDVCVASGPRDTIRSRYADILGNDWLARFYR